VAVDPRGIPAASHTSESPTRAYCPEAPGDGSAWGPPRKGRPGPLVGPRHITSLNNPYAGPGSGIRRRPYHSRFPLQWPEASPLTCPRLASQGPGAGAGQWNSPPATARRPGGLGLPGGVGRLTWSAGPCAVHVNRFAQGSWRLDAVSQSQSQSSHGPMTRLVVQFWTGGIPPN